MSRGAKSGVVVLDLYHLLWEMGDDRAGVLFLRSGIRTRRGADRHRDGCLWLRDGSKGLSMHEIKCLGIVVSF